MSMTQQLQQIYQDLDGISAIECLQVIEHLITRLKGAASTGGDAPRGVAMPHPELSAQEVFTVTQGSWGSSSLDEIDAQLDQQRQFDWGE
jgi:hypothetical protein